MIILLKLAAVVLLAILLESARRSISRMIKGVLSKIETNRCLINHIREDSNARAELYQLQKLLVTKGLAYWDYDGETGKSDFHLIDLWRGGEKLSETDRKGLSAEGQE